MSKERLIEWHLPFGYLLKQYWPAEIIFERKGWQRRSIYIKFPWYESIVHDQIKMADGTWLETKASARSVEGSWRIELPYSYVTDRGEKQECVMTVFHERSARRRHWLRWLPLFTKWTEGIDFQFSEEMGPGRGSWKGGVIGAAQTMFLGETAEQCAHRVMRDSRWS